LLKFNGAWRFEPPPDGKFNNSKIPVGVIDEFFGLVGKITMRGSRQDKFEHFKGHFCDAIGTTHIRSSSTSWAETDLRTFMEQASDNAPMFIEAFWDACESIKQFDPECVVPDENIINGILKKYKVGYALLPPELILLETDAPLVAVSERSLTLTEKANEVLQVSLNQSEQLLHEGKGREAVQEILWLLETVSTAFRGLKTDAGTIEGKYFNKIAGELKEIEKGTTFGRIVEWMMELHGYLSSPTGGGIRHGLDLYEGVTISLNEARLICNLVRSYIGFLLTEHERLTKKRG